MYALGLSDCMLRMHRQFAPSELVEQEPLNCGGGFGLGVGAPGSYPGLEKVISIKKDPQGPYFMDMASPRGLDRRPVFIEYQRNTAKVAAEFERAG